MSKRAIEPQQNEGDEVSADFALSMSLRAERLLAAMG